MGGFDKGFEKSGSVFDSWSLVTLTFIFLFLAGVAIGPLAFVIFYLMDR
jgi:hypothetical protein